MAYGHVYVIRAGDEDLFKVGKTSIPVAHRLKALQTGCPHRLSVYAAIASYFPERMEKIVHRMLSGYRTQGEWFAVESSVIDNVLGAPLLGDNPWQLRGNPDWGVEISPTSWCTRDGRPVLSSRCMVRSELEAEVYRLVTGLLQLLDEYGGKI
jgi:hypothetical protein